MGNTNDRVNRPRKVRVEVRKGFYELLHKPKGREPAFANGRPEIKDGV
ncbi:MAG: hypothetical protein ACM3SR_03720 [Ignavibacteriales bacterium]